MTKAHAKSEVQTEQFEFFRPRPDGDIDPAGEAGWFLQRQREENKITLEEASRSTNIHPFHLSAIEQGDLTGLPPRDDALAMIAAYSNFLGFDPNPLVLHFARFLPKQPMPGHRKANTKKSKARPAPLSSAKILRFPLMERLRAVSTGAGGVVASALGAVMLFGAASWVFFPGDVGSENGDKSGTTREQVAAISTIKETPLGDAGKVGDELASAADRAANGLSGLDKLIAKSGTDIQTASIPSPKPKKIQIAGKAQLDGSGGRIYGSENKGARLVLKANANVWVRIEDAKGNVVMTRTLMSGDSYMVPNRPGLVVISRDGGLLSFSIDGSIKGKLGRKGEILVGLPLDLKKLKAKKS